MSENKTRPTKQSTAEFLNSLSDPVMRKDCRVLARIMREATGKRAVLWGDSILGFGQYHYRYQSGREGDYMVTGFSTRKQSLTIYIMPGFNKYGSLLKKLGKHKHSVSCLDVRCLEDIYINVLSERIARAVKDMQKLYATNL